MATFKDSHLMKHGCGRADAYHVIVDVEGALSCGHCNENVYGPDDTASDLVLSCDAAGGRWHSVPFSIDVHRCGTDTLAEAVESMLDLSVGAHA